MEIKTPTKNSAEPLFNAGLAFLERLHKLSLIYHESMSRGEYDIAYTCLSGLTAECCPRISEDEFNNLKKHRATASSIIRMRTQQNIRIGANTPMPQNVLEDWFIDINIALHKHGLIMPNKDDMSNATKI